jgi:hypothetical protein
MFCMTVPCIFCSTIFINTGIGNMGQDLITDLIKKKQFFTVSGTISFVVSV